MAVQLVVHTLPREWVCSSSLPDPVGEAEPGGAMTFELYVPILFLVPEDPEEVGKLDTRESYLDIKKAAEGGRQPEVVVLSHHQLDVPLQFFHLPFCPS